MDLQSSPIRIQWEDRTGRIPLLTISKLRIISSFLGEEADDQDQVG
jgi:hypothetical protein